MEKIYPPRTAGSFAETAVPTCRPEDSVELVLSFMRELAGTYRSINYIYVREEHALVGVISIHELFCANPRATIRSIMTTNVASVHVWTDQEQVAELALAQSIKAVPVVDDNNEFVGIISSDKILQILNEEHVDDLAKSAGIQIAPQEAAGTVSILKSVRSRIPWLVIGLFGGIGAAFVVDVFEATIATQIALAAFIPTIVYVGDAVGNQSEMLFIRWLSRRSEISAFTYLVREWMAGTAIGLFLAALMFSVSYLWLQNFEVSIVLMFTILATVYLSITITVVLPWLFEKLGFDPAVASGPLATVLCDISSLCLYLVIATAIL